MHTTVEEFVGELRLHFEVAFSYLSKSKKSKKNWDGLLNQELPRTEIKFTNLTLQSTFT